MSVSKKFRFHEQLAVGTIADGLVEIYQHPTSDLIRKYARDLLAIADVMEAGGR